MNEQPLNLSASLQEIRRRWFLVSFVTLLCALGGVAFAALRPPDSTAVTLVLLPTHSGSNAVAQPLSTGTQSVVAASTPVLAEAGSKVTPPLQPIKLKQLLTITQLSQQVLAIQVRASNGAYAEQLANAVASSYIKYAGRLGASSSGVSALQQESAHLTQQIQSLQDQINTATTRIASEGAASSAGQQDNALVTSLQNEQNQVSLQLNTVNGQIVAAQVAASPAGNSIRVLQKAALQPASHTSGLIEGGFIGLAIGLVVSCTFVLIRRQNDPRLHLRDEIAQAAGVPVIASLEAHNCTTVDAWHTLLEGQPGTASAWALRRMLHTVLSGGAQFASHVRVFSFDGDVSALAAGPMLALYAAASGTPTALVLEDHRGLDSLQAALTGPERVGQGLPITVGLSEGGDPPRLVVSIGIMGGDLSTSSPLEGTTILSVSPGFATADELGRTAVKADMTHSPLEMIVIVNPDPADQTSGISLDDRLRLLPFHADTDRKAEVGRPAPQANGASSSAEFPLTRDQ